MSYEGSVQFLCEKGHVSVRDCYDEAPVICDEVVGYPDDTTELVCGAAITERNDIDETNGCYGDPCQCGAKELVEIEPAQYETCNLGHRHEKVPARYKFGEVKCHNPDGW